MRCFLKDWSDLIEYVIHKFINIPQKNKLSSPSHKINLTETDFPQLNQEEFSIK